MRTEALGTAYFVVPDGAGPHPGVVVIHEAYGLNDNIRDICHRLGEQGYAALGVDLFAGRSRALCMARMLSSWATGNLNDSGVTELKAALGQLSQRPEVDPERVGAIGFCMG